MDLEQELAHTRARIRNLRIDMSRLGYPGWPWESRYNTEAALARMERREAELLDLIHADDQRTERLMDVALRSGDPITLAVAYVAAGVAAGDAQILTNTFSA
jgi:hypothetical protein